MTLNLKTKTKKIYSKGLVLFSVSTLVLFWLVLPQFTHAAYTIDQVDVSNAPLKDFVVGPGKVELDIEPGQSQTTAVTVTNRMGGTRTFNLEVEDFRGSRNPSEAAVLLGQERGPYSLRDFIHFEKSSFVLKNGERATIPVRVTLPTDVEPGGLYGSLLVSTTAKEATSAQRSAIVTRLGVLFFVKTPGDVQEDGALSKFTTKEDKTIFGSGPVDFQILYENNGSIYLNPYGEIRIKNIIGEEVGVVGVDPWFAMPQSLRLREVSWNRPFLIGRYSATASINRGYGNIVDTQTISFWVLPWKILSLAAAVVVLLAFVLRLIFSRFEIKRK